MLHVEAKLTYPNMSWHEWLWYASIIMVAVLTLAIGYFWSITVAGLFWVVSVLMLLVLRPE